MDAAGKTTTLYKLKLGEVVTTIPTIGKAIRRAAGSADKQFALLNALQDLTSKPFSTKM